MRIVVLIASLLCSSLLFADSPRVQADSAYALLQADQVEQAAGMYQSLVDEGYSTADLHFNLGNAYFKAGQLGHAMLAFERARHLRPTDPQILYNLELTNYEIDDNYHWEDNRYITTRIADSIGSKMPTNLLLILAFMTLVFSIVTYGLYRLQREQAKPRLLTIAKITGIIAVVFFLLSWLGHRYDTLNIGAIILPQAVNVYAAPDSLSSSNLTIHAGTKVYIQDQMTDYSRIVLPSGTAGWIHDSHYEFIHP